MEELILSLDPHLHVKDCKITDHEIIFDVSSILDHAHCPKCKQISTSVHDFYLTHIQDLPIQGKTVYLQLMIRRFKCNTPSCSKKTFSETFSFKEDNAQKTNRLMTLIVDLAESRSALGTSKDLEELGVLVKKSSLCKYIGQKKKIDVDYDVIEICIDDFALKKRQRYGTIMVDITIGKIVDLLESREKEDVVEWLKKFRQIKLVSRDGSRTYAAAIREAHPQAIQVTDRFHLISRLCDIAQTLMRSFFLPRIPVEISDKKYEKFEDFLLYASRLDKIIYVKKLNADGMTNQEIRMKTGFSLQTIVKYLKMKNEELPEDKEIFWERHHNQMMRERQNQIDEVRDLSMKGTPISEISDITGYTSQTVVRYLEKNPSSISGQYGIDRLGKLMNYRREVLELRKEKKTYQEIFQIISEKGYTGTVDAIRGYMSRQRRLHKHFKEEYKNKSIEIVERKWLNKLFYLPIEKVPMINKDLLELIFSQHPMYAKIHHLVWDFRNCLKKQDFEEFENWVNFVKKTFEDSSLLGFVESLLTDRSAFNYAMTHKHNNGLAEGSVNKIKTIKRQMYGRCSFNLLRKKVLALENR